MTVKNSEEGSFTIAVILTVLAVVLLTGFILLKTQEQHAAPESRSASTSDKTDYITCRDEIRGNTFRVKKSNTKNILSTGPTNPQNIKVVTPGKFLPADSRYTYLLNKSAEPITVVAPADGTVISVEFKTRSDLGSDLVQPDYDIEVAIDCDTTYRIHHITNPSDEIKSLSPAKEPYQIVPGNPISNFNTTPPREFMVKAGDVIGTTTGTPAEHNWDFTVFIKGEAVCPYEQLPQDQREQWMSLMGYNRNPIAGTPCDVSGRK